MVPVSLNNHENGSVEGAEQDGERERDSGGEEEEGRG